jgi:hypothetical protein
MSHRIVLAFIFTLTLGLNAPAQESRATVSGSITDPTGAAVPRASVHVTSVERRDPVIHDDQ